jgi:hypothetical protein
MAKIILFLLVLALVIASTSKISGAAAAEDDTADLQRRRETMAEVQRVFSSPVSAAAADSETTHRLASFLQRELGPLGPIFRAIRVMPRSTAAEIRAWEEAFDAAQQLLGRHFGQLLAPHGSAKASDDDDDLAQRRQAMEEVVRFARPEPAAAADAQTTRRLSSFLTREMGPLQDILIAILKMPESSVKDEAFDAAMELLDGKFRLLLPGARPMYDGDVGFAIGKMPEGTAAEVRRKEETRAAAKEMIRYHLGQLIPGGISVKMNDDL